MNKFFEFSQNNSGGSFDGFARFVFIQARNADDANARAEKLGLYFDGCENGIDCDCCGDRWSRVYDEDGVAEEELRVYYRGKMVLVSEFDVQHTEQERRGGEIDLFRVYYADGRVVYSSLGYRV